MPNMRSRLLDEELTDNVVPGHTRTSPPRGRCRMVVSEPALTEEPVERRLASMAADSVPATTGTTAASGVRVNPGAVIRAACTGSDFFPALTSSGGRRRTISRLPAPSQEWPYGAKRSSTMRVTGGSLLY